MSMWGFLLVECGVVSDGLYVQRKFQISNGLNGCTPHTVVVACSVYFGSSRMNANRVFYMYSENPCLIYSTMLMHVIVFFGFVDCVVASDTGNIGTAAAAAAAITTDAAADIADAVIVIVFTFIPSSLLFSLLSVQHGFLWCFL